LVLRLRSKQVKEERKDGRKNRWRVGDVTGGRKEEGRKRKKKRSASTELMYWDSTIHG